MAEFRHETQRLILRDWRERDWPEFWRGTNTPAVMRWLGGVLDEDGRARTRERLESYARQHGHTFWAVEQRSDKAVLGFCGLKKCTSAGGPIGAMEAGWRLREDAWGQGFASEAAIATLVLAFEKFEAEEVIALTVEGNSPSRNLMKRIGMVRREDLDFTEDHWSGEQRPAIVYSISRKQWERSQ